ncbi:hypothetical protein DAPPUDRAFT_238105 [Daphnia pulex]|uniref:Uncharacterized protein n=1 Tax=Daphnia pulex TaxID=6669 RepID=E9G577_DAPPU|nr:hypothetical protein DAPPUDRAFT_238105 [Daphnia pulex]|eukprot:EFX85427.1 hypothetical protein DAPPUDRAFT_238105 [Daphnia pulex]
MYNFLFDEIKKKIIRRMKKQQLSGLVRRLLSTVKRYERVRPARDGGRGAIILRAALSPTDAAKLLLDL